MNGIFFVPRVGVPWRLLLKDQPTKCTVCGYFSACRDNGLFATSKPAFATRFTISLTL